MGEMNTFEPSLAAMIGGWELLFILLAMMVLLIAVAGAVALGIWLVRKYSAPPAAAHKPPVTEKTEVLRRCPKCGSTLRADVPEGLCPTCLLQQGIATEAGPQNQPAFTPPTLEELAKLFPQLEIISAIGKGGMGAVYKARQPALDRFVALKILAPNPSNELDFGSRFSREARALARLSHPNIVAVYDFGQINGLSYFIMEFVDGPNLRQVQQAGKLAPKEALEIIPQICAALQFAHDEGIVHRDIKPENVLLDRKGRVKIADFGLAKILGQEPKDFRLTGARDVMGTPHYMAPEQVEKPQEVDHRADIYSLGVVFYEMLTGELPLGKFAPPSQRVQVDVRLDDVVLRALEKEPARRYQQANEFKTRVETVASGGRVEDSFKAVPRDQAFGKLSIAALGLFGVGVLGTLFLMALSTRHGTALVFGAVAIIAALVAAVIGWREKACRIFIYGTGALTVLAFAAFGVMALVINPIRAQHAREGAEREEQRLELLASQHRAAREEIPQAASVTNSPPPAVPPVTILNPEPVPAPPLEPIPAPAPAAAPVALPPTNVAIAVALPPVAPDPKPAAPEPTITSTHEPQVELPILGVETLRVPRRNVEFLIRRATVRTGRNFEIWNRTPRRNREPELRRNVVRRPLILVSDSPRPKPVQAEVFWLPTERRFYVQWDRVGSTNLHYYGPFDGEPESVLKRAVPSPEQVSRELTARLAAAEEIVMFSERDTTLAGIAEDAANEGEVALVKRSLDRMTSFSARDDAATRAAGKLAEKGQSAEAFEIIGRSMTAFSKRDAALAGIVEEAAADGDTALVKRILREMTSFSVRDDATCRAARKLAANGQRADALEISRTITSFSTRSEMLRELAR